MPFIRCPACNARYKVSAEAGGKHAKCQSCGQGFKIPTLPAPAGPANEELRLAPGDFAHGADAIELQRPPETTAAGSIDGEPLEAVPLTSTVVYAPGDADEDVAVARGAYGEYLKSLARSLAFPARVGDLITFGIIGVALVLGNFAARSGICILAAAAWIIAGWYMSFQLNIVLGAAAGDEELPALSLTEGFWDSVVAPFLKMVAAEAVSYLPMYAFLLSAGVASVVLRTGLTFGGLSALWGLVDAKTLVVAGVLFLAGGFVWPMLVLVVAVGNVVGFLRVDLIARIIARSLPAYLLTVAAVYVSLALQLGFAALLGAAAKSPGGLGQAPAVEWLLAPVLVLVELYFSIVAMRAIGFYYHHFKDRFAWSWG